MGAPDKITFTGPGGIRLVLDRKEFVPDNPGDGTPQMVFVPFARGSATLQCALCDGVLEDGRRGSSTELTDKQLAWLAQCEEDANAFVYRNDDQAVFRLQLRSEQ